MYIEREVIKTLFKNTETLFFFSQILDPVKHYELCESYRRHPVQSIFSFLLFLYTVSCMYKRDYLHGSTDILFKLCSILLT